MVKRLFENSDKIGALSSMLCLVHCLAFPLLIGFFPFLHLAEPIEFLFLAISVVAVFISVYNAQKKRSVETRIMVISLIVLIASVALEEKIEIFHFISYVSAFTLALAHYLSFRKQRACKV